MKKDKTQGIQEAKHIMRSLKPSALKHKVQLELKQLKEESLRGSYTYAEVAEEFNIYLRSFKEYVSGKRKPGKGEAATRYGLVLEKYYLNTNVDRWFIRDDYKE